MKDSQDLKIHLGTPHMLPDPGLPETWKAIAEAAEASVGVTYLKMYRYHGEVPPGGCKACYDEDPRNWVNFWRPAEYVYPCGPTGTCSKCESQAYSQMSIDFWEGFCYDCFLTWATTDQLKKRGLCK